MSRVTLAIISTALVILFLAGTGTNEFNLSGSSSQVLNGIGAAFSAIIVVIIALIARTPNRWWHP